MNVGMPPKYIVSKENYRCAVVEIVTARRARFAMLSTSHTDKGVHRSRNACKAASRNWTPFTVAEGHRPIANMGARFHLIFSIRLHVPTSPNCGLDGSACVRFA